MRIIIQGEEGIGNAVLKFPIAKALRKQHPGCIVDSISSDRNYELNKLSKIYDTVYRWSPDLKINDHYDMVIDAVFTSSVYIRKITSFDRLLQCQKTDFLRKHETQHNLDLIGWNGEFIPVNFQIDRLPEQHIVGIHIGCFGSHVWGTRKWFTGKWVQLCRDLYAKYKIKINIFGGSTEEYLSGVMYKNLKNEIDIENYCGKLSIMDTAKQLTECKALISLDSGIMHLASAVGVKSLSLWGPTWEGKSHPWVDNSMYFIIRSSTNCGGCYIKDRKGVFDKCVDNKCMQNIYPSTIITEVERLKWL